MVSQVYYPHCQFYPWERALLRERWRQRLNSHHLFSELPAARGFCGAADERVPEHAPFFPYALWVVEVVNGKEIGVDEASPADGGP